MTGMKINLDFEDASSMFDGIDSSYLSLPVKKFVVYVDSTICSGCFINKLTEYFEMNDSLKSSNSHMIVVLHPPYTSNDEVIEKLRHERFPFWCIVDSNGSFIKNNPAIQDNHLLHAFTVDENDKIILVGDPIRNVKINKLFLRLLNE